MTLRRWQTWMPWALAGLALVWALGLGVSAVVPAADARAQDARAQITRGQDTEVRFVQGQLSLPEGGPLTYQAQEYDGQQQDPFVVRIIPDDDLQPVQLYGFRPKIQEGGGDGGGGDGGGDDGGGGGGAAGLTVGDEEEAVFTVVDLNRDPPTELGTVTLKPGDPPAETPTEPPMFLSVKFFTSHDFGTGVCQLTIPQSTSKVRVQACAVGNRQVGECATGVCQGDV